MKRNAIKKGLYLAVLATISFGGIANATPTSNPSPTEKHAARKVEAQRLKQQHQSNLQQQIQNYTSQLQGYTGLGQGPSNNGGSK
jgi:hypothetical protein